MDNIVDRLQDTAVYLKQQEETIEGSINVLSENEDKLRSYLMLYMLANKSKDALEKMKDALPDIEIRLREEIDRVCKQAREILDGAETRAKWLKDIMDALGELCGSTDLSGRENALHNQMEEMETALKVLIAKRNELPLNQLDKEK